ncbi:hypothetical protein BC829DRAFT_413195 [Chytridium lagenaria]|nr:hypothetical protein BC829DRAFT_413195 [Chytridium lagenaria]
MTARPSIVNYITPFGHDTDYGTWENFITGLIGADKAAQTLNPSYIDNTANPGVPNAIAALELGTPNGLHDFVIAGQGTHYLRPMGPYGLHDFVIAGQGTHYTFAPWTATARLPSQEHAPKTTSPSRSFDNARLHFAADALRLLREHYSVNTIEQRQAVIDNFTSLTMRDGESLTTTLIAFTDSTAKSYISSITQHPPVPNTLTSALLNPPSMSYTAVSLPLSLVIFERLTATDLISQPYTKLSTPSVMKLAT